MAFDREYFDAVYRSEGLVLWRAETNGGTFDIRLQAGNDVSYEGGLSVVAHFNGGRICVLSYSVVPAHVLLPNPNTVLERLRRDDSVLFVTRKQLDSNHTYQKPFNQAFNRATIGHFCMAAVAGLALEQGWDRLVGISPAAHPSFKTEFEKQFDTAYAQFWQSFHGRQLSPYAFLIDLPLQLTSLDQLPAKARKRAIERRQHMDAVVTSSRAAIRRHLVHEAERSVRSIGYAMPGHGLLSASLERKWGHAR